MAKNELLPFANGEDANVLPTQQWEALADILENGFQSGIARSEQVNRVLAQGAVASYVLGQLIVDQLNKDATLNKDTLYQNLVSALQENAKDVCLPLGGGTMLGRIRFPTGVIASNNTDTLKELFVGSDNDSGIFGAFLSLHSLDCLDAPGAFGLFTRKPDGSQGPSLFAERNGVLRWDGKNVSALALPSSTKNQLTIGASGTTYTAPADGWFNFRGGSTSGNRYLSAINQTTLVHISGTIISGIANANIMIPARKGEKIEFAYSANSGVEGYFVYAVGAI